MTSPSVHHTSPPRVPDAQFLARLEALRAEAHADADPARRAKLLHAVGRLLEVVDDNDVAAANEYLAAFQSNRAQQGALVDLIGIYERRKSATNLAKLHQVEAKSASNADARADALLDLAAVREDLASDLAGAQAALADAIQAAPEHADVALMAELAAHATSDALDISERLRARLTTTDDPALAAELLIDRAELMGSTGALGDAVDLLRRADGHGASAVRLALALERIARKAEDRAARADALERLGDLAASAIHSAADFDEPGVGPLLWEDALASRAVAVAAYRAAANARAANGEPPARVIDLLTRAVEIEPNAPWVRLERLAVAQRAGRDDLVIEDEDALVQSLSGGPLSAFILNRVAGRFERAGRGAEASEMKAEARRLAPNSAVLKAAEQAGLRDRSHAQSWFDSLDVDAPGVTSMQLAEAAFVADELLSDFETARQLYERALVDATDGTPILRALYAASLAHDDLVTANAALARMRGLDPASERRRAFDRVVITAISLDDPAPSVELARGLLAQRDASTAQVARAIGALADDHALVEEAHVLLAELAPGADERAAHRCAAARAAAAAGDPNRAEKHATAALDCVDGHVVAVAILDAILRARNDVEGLGALARRAAAGRSGESTEASDDARAAIAACLSGDFTIAVAGATKLLEADAPSPFSARVASFVADAANDPSLRRAARERAERTETAFGRARAALALARELVSTGDPDAAVPHLTLALNHTATALDAAIGVSLLKAPPAELAERAMGVLRESGIDDSPTWFVAATQAQAPNASSPTWFDDAIAAESDLAAERSVAVVAEQAGGASAIASQVVRHLRDSTEADVLDDLGLLVLRAAATPGGGELAAAIGDISFGPDDDISVRRAAVEAALREATPDDAKVYSAQLGRMLASAGRSAEAYQYLDRAVREQPDNLAAWEALRLAARDCGKHARFVDACDALAAATSGDTKAEMLEDAATVLAESLKRPGDALERARAAMQAAPGRERAHTRAKALLASMRDDAGLAELASSRAASTVDSAGRVKQLFEAARHLRTAGDRQGAMSPLDQILELDPAHAGALAMQAEIYVSLEAYDDAVASLRRLASADVPLAQKRVARLGAADFLERKLNKPADAYAELVAIDALGLADPAILQRMARMSADNDRFDDALALHDRVASSGAIPLRVAESLRAAAQIMFKSKRDAAGAAEKLRRALELVPDDVESAALLLHIVDDENERGAIVRTTDAAVRAKLIPEGLTVVVLRKLLRISDIRGARDLTKLVLSTLTALRSATEEERAREEDNTAIVRRVRPPAAPIAEALAQLRTAGDSGPFSEIASALFELLVELDGVDLSRFGASRSDPMSRGDAVRTELSDLALAFGIADAESYPSPQLDNRKLVVLPTDHSIAFVVPRGIAIPLDPALRFDAGRLTWAVANRTLPLVQRSTDEAVAILLGALDACDVPIGDLKSRPAVGTWAKTIGRAISRKQKRAVHDLGVTIRDAGAGAESYCRAVRQSSFRAGLLVSSDLDGALNRILGAAPTLAATVASPDAADLVCFHLSSTSLMLRRELGLAS